MAQRRCRKAQEKDNQRSWALKGENMFNYAVKLTQDAETRVYEVSCRDLPLMHSVGDTPEEALLEAEDGIVTAISLEMDMRRPIPVATPPERMSVLLSFRFWLQ
jgi:antitoxin HicB